MKDISEKELEEIEARALKASTGPWKSYIEGRDHDSGDSFIMIGSGYNRQEDMYVSRGSGPLSSEDLDFIAHARQDVSVLVAEIKRLKSESQT